MFNIKKRFFSLRGANLKEEFKMAKEKTATAAKAGAKATAKTAKAGAKKTVATAKKSAKKL